MPGHAEGAPVREGSGIALQSAAHHPHRSIEDFLSAATAFLHAVTRPPLTASPVRPRRPAHRGSPSSRRSSRTTRSAARSLMAASPAGVRYALHEAAHQPVEIGYMGGRRIARHGGSTPWGTKVCGSAGHGGGGRGGEGRGHPAGALPCMRTVRSGWSVRGAGSAGPVPSGAGRSPAGRAGSAWPRSKLLLGLREAEPPLEGRHQVGVVTGDVFGVLAGCGGVAELGRDVLLGAAAGPPGPAHRAAHRARV
ncbi:hypothetical protein SGRIM128S_05156 [Streptomyces griseomycini]